jgi:hypothetical protein
VFGTSASSPVVGAMITNINDARLAIGKKPLGFINPCKCPYPGVPHLRLTSTQRCTRRHSPARTTTSPTARTPDVVLSGSMLRKAGTPSLVLGESLLLVHRSLAELRLSTPRFPILLAKFLLLP